MGWYKKPQTHHARIFSRTPFLFTHTTTNCYFKVAISPLLPARLLLHPVVHREHPLAEIAFPLLSYNSISSTGGCKEKMEREMEMYWTQWCMQPQAINTREINQVAHLNKVFKSSSMRASVHTITADNSVCRSGPVFNEISN